MKLKLYESPANQPGNKYCVGNTTEKIQMEAIVSKADAILDAEYICETVMATLSMGIDLDERPTEAKNKGCNHYLAIHSNATDKPVDTVTGAKAFYHPNSVISKDLATNLVRELNAICPIPNTITKQIASGMTQYKGQGYGEIRSPMQLGVPSTLIEINFHNNPIAAQWIIDNHDIIARAIVKALATTFNLVKKIITPPISLVKRLYPNRLLKLTKISARDAEVVAVQTQLNKLGFNCGKVDGWFYTATQKAVKKFQTSKKIQVDGKVGPQTWGLLF